MREMRADPADREAVERIERMLQATAGEDPALRAAVVNAFGSGQKTADTLWRWIVAGFLVLATIALAGLLYLIADSNPGTEPDLALTAFVGLLGGLLGLLIGAPWRGSSTSG
jgi:ferric-dicitrate binding protein FerR (iron transport regulator)